MTKFKQFTYADTAELDNAISYVIGDMRSESDRAVISAVAADVSEALGGSNKRLIFVRCGEGDRLKRLITAVSLLLPKEEASLIALDIAPSSVDGEMPDGYKIDDLITGFADGIGDGAFEKSKHYKHTYKLYDMSDISSISSGEPTEFSEAASGLLSDSESARNKVVLYRGILDGASEGSAVSRIKYAAETAERLISFAENERSVEILAACAKGEAKGVAEGFAELLSEANGRSIENCFALLSIVGEWKGMSDIIPEAIERACFTKEYIEVLCRRVACGEGVAEEEIARFKELGAYDRLAPLLSASMLSYAETNADGIAEGVMASEPTAMEAYKKVCLYGGKEVCEIAENALESRFSEMMGDAARKLVAGDRGEADSLTDRVKAVGSKEIVIKCSLIFEEAIHKEFIEKADLIADAYLGAAHEDTVKLLDGVFSYSKACENFFPEILINRLEKDLSISDGIRDGIIAGTGAEETLRRLGCYLKEEKLDEAIAASFCRYLDTELNATASGLLSGDEGAERVYNEVSKRCPDRLQSLKDGLREAYSASVGELAEGVLQGEKEKHVSQLSLMKKYIPEEAESGIYEAALTDELKARMLVLSPELIRKITAGDAEAFDRLPIADPEYEGVCREVVVQELDRWLLSVEGGAYLTSLSGELFDSYDEAIRKLVALEGFLPQVCGDGYLREKFRAVATERRESLAKALFEGEARAVENYRTVGAYGSGEEQRGVLDTFMTLCDGEYYKNAEALYLGDDGVARKRIETLSQCDVTEEYAKKYRNALGEAVMEYIRENGCERLTALAMRKLDGDEEDGNAIEHTIAKYAPDIRPVIADRIGEIALSEYASLEAGIAGEDYAAVYERLNRFCKYTSVIDSQSCVIGGLNVYFDSAEYKNGFAECSAEVSARLAFFFEAEQEAARHTIKEALLRSFTETGFLFAGESVTEPYERVRRAFKETLTAYDCFSAVLDYYKENAVGGKHQVMLVDFVTEFIKRAKKHVNDSREELEAYESVCVSDYGKAVLEEIFKFELRRVDDYAGVERLLGIYDTVSRRRATELINSLDNQYKREQLLGAVFKVSDDDIVKKFREYLKSGDGELAEEYYARYARSRLTCYARFCLLTEAETNVERLVLSELNENGLWDELCMGGAIPRGEAFSMLLTIMRKLSAERDRNILLGRYIRLYGIASIELTKLMEANGGSLKQKRKSENLADAPYFYRVVRFFYALTDKNAVPESEYDKVFLAPSTYNERAALRTLKSSVIYAIGMGRIAERHFESLAEHFKQMDADSSYAGWGTGSREQILFLLNEAKNLRLADSSKLRAFGGYFGLDEKADLKMGWEPVFNEYAEARVFDEKHSPLKLFIDICVAKSVSEQERRGVDPKQLKRLGARGIDMIAVNKKYPARAIALTELGEDIANGDSLEIILHLLGFARQDAGDMREVVGNFAAALSRKKGARLTGNAQIEDSATAELKRCLAVRAALACAKGKMKRCSLDEAYGYFGDDFAAALVEFVFRSDKIRDPRCLKLLASIERGVYLERLKCGLGDFSRLKSSSRSAVLKTLVKR